MNTIVKKPIDTLGYGFIEDRFLPGGADEYYLRQLQNNGIAYRKLTTHEIEQLVRNNNTSDDWNKINVSNEFTPELVKNCKFFGWVRIGKLEPVYLEYHNVCLPVGLYNSTIISCDFGDNVVISNVNYLAHYIIGNEVMISNVHELHATAHAKFGNGIVKEGEEEGVRIWLEVRNENGGRKIMPFNGMLPGDAYLWSKYRDDEAMQQKFKDFTEKAFDKRRGYYGKIGDRTVIKNTSIIKDVWIGSDAYIKGANKLKNLTINSDSKAGTQIGEGCEIVNGIIGVGCRIFYGAKAVRFVMASHSQLKYGARLINSYLGNNATISCCEVLNALIYPAHEQHHNNSFLCAALVMGQSNIAAGATIGSNHNSRAADGEIVAGRGFWPGLCVSLKHNSKFASFTLLAKGDYSAELNIPIPFSLVSNNEAQNCLVIMPAYWFQYNMYALARNSAKYVDRDKRTERLQYIEYDYLAPDTINEIFDGIYWLRRCAALAGGLPADTLEAELLQAGEELLLKPASDNLIVTQQLFENSKRPVQIVKAHAAYEIFKKLIVYYAVKQVLAYSKEKSIANMSDLLQQLDVKSERNQWQNIGGQLMPQERVTLLLHQVKSGTIQSWDDLHRFYAGAAADYTSQKTAHAMAALLEIMNLSVESFSAEIFKQWCTEAIETRAWIAASIKSSRAKDYENPFRSMVYENEAEMDKVIGKLEDNVFIKQEAEAAQVFAREVTEMSIRF